MGILYMQDKLQKEMDIALGHPVQAICRVELQIELAQSGTKNLPQ